MKFDKEFKEYRRTQKAQMRPVNSVDIHIFDMTGKIEYDGVIVSISQADKEAGSPKDGDMIARNPENHKDVWLVAKKYYEDNFEIIE